MGGVVGLELGIDIYTLLYTEEMTNRDLLYSTGNSAQYSAVAYMGTESKKNECIYTYIYIWLNHFSVRLKLTQYCKSTILQYNFFKLIRQNKVIQLNP